MFINTNKLYFELNYPLIQIDFNFLAHHSNGSQFSKALARLSVILVGDGLTDVLANLRQGRRRNISTNTEQVVDATVGVGEGAGRCCGREIVHVTCTLRSISGGNVDLARHLRAGEGQWKENCSEL